MTRYFKWLIIFLPFTGLILCLKAVFISPPQFFAWADSQPLHASYQSLDEHNKKLANIVNQLPGARVRIEDLQPKTQEKGFHPIKKLLSPITKLQEQSIRLEQQIMRLEGPIAGLQPPMLKLHDRMTTVQKEMGTMEQEMTEIQVGMNGMKTDISNMRQQITELQKPITSLQKPISSLEQPIAKLQRPIAGVQDQLTDLKVQLDDLKSLIHRITAFMLLAILVASILVAVGTPIAGILLWRKRKTLFAGKHELESIEKP